MCECMFLVWTNVPQITHPTSCSLKRPHPLSELMGLLLAAPKIASYSLQLRGCCPHMMAHLGCTHLQLQQRCNQAALVRGEACMSFTLDKIKSIWIRVTERTALTSEHALEYPEDPLYWGWCWATILTGREGSSRDSIKIQLGGVSIFFSVPKQKEAISTKLKRQLMVVVGIISVSMLPSWFIKS